MTENDRIKMLRKELLSPALSQEEFGAKLGVTKMAISKIEGGYNAVTDQMRLAICREYGVRAEWLRDGSGDPFEAVSADDEIQRLADEVMKDSPESFRRRFVAALAKLTPEQWDMLSDVADLLLDGQKSKEVEKPAADPIDPTPERMDEIKSQLADEKKARDESSVSSRDGQTGEDLDNNVAG